MERGAFEAHVPTFTGSDPAGETVRIIVILYVELLLIKLGLDPGV